MRFGEVGGEVRNRLADATVIRSILVPRRSRFLVVNWWMPAGLERVLRVTPRPALDCPPAEGPDLF